MDNVYKEVFTLKIYKNQEMMLDANRSFPPVRASVFSQAMTGVTFLGDPSTGSGLPRGTMIYANQPIPQQVKFFEK